MHYYTFHIGDYTSHTSHLDEMEDLAYRRLLDAYYLHEQPLPLNVQELARLIRMRSHSDCIAVVLDEFFEQTDAGWVSTRADQEIARMVEKSSKASVSAKMRWEKVKCDASAMRTHSEGNATNTQYPIPKTHKPVKDNFTPEGVSQSVWQEFVEHRKRKKARVSKLVITGIQREAEKAGWTLEQALSETVVRGWASFKAEWVVEKKNYTQQAADIARSTVPSKPGIDPVLARINQDREAAKPMPEHIRAQIKQALGK